MRRGTGRTTVASRHLAPAGWCATRGEDMTQATTASAPTVVLVHGAFADSSGWNDVVSGLLAAGIPVQAVSNPLRGIAHDADYVAALLSQVPGPVLAVGHSYGGAVI